MITKIRIETYFGDPKGSLSSSDVIKLRELRDSINSYQTMREQLRYIKIWRSDEKNRSFDMRVFDISPSAYIDRELERSIEYSNKVNIYWNGRKSEDLDKLESATKIKTKSPGNFTASGWLRDHNFKKASNILLKMKMSPSLCLGIFLTIIAIFLIVSAFFFIYGVISSIGSTPFEFIK